MFSLLRLVQISLVVPILALNLPNLYWSIRKHFPNLGFDFEARKSRKATAKTSEKEGRRKDLRDYFQMNPRLSLNGAGMEPPALDSPQKQLVDCFPLFALFLHCVLQCLQAGMPSSLFRFEVHSNLERTRGCFLNHEWNHLLSTLVFELNAYKHIQTFATPRCN